jgi:hypothetical protein
MFLRWLELALVCPALGLRIGSGDAVLPSLLDFDSTSSLPGGIF